jgi:hypothetical protein
MTAVRVSFPFFRVLSFFDACFFVRRHKRARARKSEVK